MVGVAAISIGLAWIIYIERKHRPVSVTAAVEVADDEEEGDEL